MTYCPECLSEDLEELESRIECTDCGATFELNSTDDDYSEYDDPGTND